MKVWKVYPTGHHTAFRRPMDLCMKSGFHVDVHWTSDRRLMPTEIV